jgi:hypothetical protein
MYLVTYSNFIHNGHRGTAISSSVVWQSALLAYNFMSATIPALKGFMTRFATGGVGYTEDLSVAGASSGNSYRMRSLSRSRTKTKVILLPEGHPESKAHITAAPRPDRDSNLGVMRRGDDGTGDTVQESDSIISHNSRRIMIRKDWAVSRA